MQSPLQRKVLTILLFVGFLNLFLFHGMGPLAFSLLVAGFFTFLLGIFKPASTKSELQVTIVSGLLLLCLQLILNNRANWFVIGILMLTSLVGLAVYTYLASSGLNFVRSLLEFLLIPVHLGLSYIQSGLALLQKLLSQDFSIVKKPTGIPSRLTSLLVGLVIGIPIVIILVTLFSAADPIFSSYVNMLFGNIKLGNIQTRLIFSAVWLTLLSPFILFFGKKEFKSPLVELERMKFTREMSVVMTMVALTIGAFLVVQFPYIFVQVPAETDLSKFGVATYSEYVTKGFFELLFVSFFIYGIIWLGLVFLRRKPRTEQKPLLYLQLVVLTEFVIFLISIARRVWLYQAHHGLSLTRVYGSFFLIWLGFIAATLFARHFWHKRWVRLELAVTVLFILGFGFFNAENYIATHNPPHVNKRTDYVYLSRMSSDGTTGWKKAYQFADDVLRKQRNESQLITRDERREIAYAGSVLNQLMYRFHDLVHRYGTPAEKTEFNIAVMQSFIQMIQSEVARTNSAESVATLAQLDSLLQDQQNSSLPKELNINVYPYSYPISFEGVSPACSFHDGVICNQFYWWTNDVNLMPDRKSTLDTIFTWNGSQANAYKKMRQEIPLVSLLNLEERYFEFYEKIKRQPSEERSFDVDISFDTPFLGGL